MQLSEPSTRGQRPGWGLWLWIGIASILYFLGAKLGLSQAVVHESASSLWPPTGIAIAAVLLLGYRACAGIFIAAWLANATSTHSTVPAAAAIAAGNTLEAAACVFLLNSLAAGHRMFDFAGSIIRYALFAAPVGCAVSASIGVIALVLSGAAPAESAGAVWTTWWLGDLVSALVFAPLLLVWLLVPPPRFSLRKCVEAAALIATTIAIAGLIFGNLLPPPYDKFPQPFLVIPPLVWGSYRFGRHGAVTVTFIIAIVAVWNTLKGQGPFFEFDPSSSLVLLQIFTGTVAVTGLVIAALLHQQRRAEVAADQTQDRLEIALWAGNMGAWEWDLAADEFIWTPTLEAIHGLESGSFGGSMEDFQRSIYPEDRESVVATLRRAIREELEYHAEYRILMPDREVKWLETNGRVIRDDSGKAQRMVGVCTDITSRKSAEQRLAAKHAITRILAEASSLADAAPGILRALGESVDGSVSALWIPDACGRHIRCAQVWTKPLVQDCDGFLDMTREIQFDCGVGLPGRVWSNRTAAGIVDLAQDSNFPRRHAAAQAGLHSGLAFPIAAAGEVFGVIEFFTNYRLEADPPLLRMITVLGQDIAQFIRRKLAEKSLADAQQQLQVVADTMNAPVTRCGRDLTYKWANRQYAQWIGLPADQIINRPIHEVIGTEAFERLLPYIQRVLAGETVNYEAQLQFRAGRLIWVAGSYAPTFDASGAVDGWVALIQSIDDRKKFEDVLRDSEHRAHHSLEELRAIYRDTPVGLCFIDPDLKFAKVNSRMAAFSGLEPEQLIGRCADETTLPGVNVVQALRDALAAGVPLERECTAQSPADPDVLRNWLVSFYPVKDSDDRVLGVNCVVHDITERKRIESEIQLHRERLEELVVQRTSQLESTHQQLRLSERMASMGTLAAGLGHDMGNLLLPIRSRLDVLRSAFLPVEAGEHVEAIETCVKHLQTLVRGLRLFSLDPMQQDSGDVSDLTEWVDEAAPFFNGVLFGNIQLVVDIPKDLPPLAIASHALTQAVLNLINNARDAIGPDRSGEIILRATMLDQVMPNGVAAGESQGGQRPHVRLSVIDNGPGMAPEVLAHAVEPFFTTRTRTLSTGLGLSVVHGLMRSAGGAMEIHSPPRGSSGTGTEVSLYLPVMQRMQFSSTPDGEKPVAAVSVSNPRNRALLATVFESLGFNVVQDANGSPGNSEVWITEATDDRLPAARDFLQSQSDRRVILIGGAPEPWQELDVRVIDQTCTPSAIRAALDS